MYLVLLSFFGLCCGQSIMDSDKQFALLEKRILENVRQPVIEVVNSVENENDMLSKANQRAIQELQLHIRTQDWQNMLNRSITPFFQSHVQKNLDEYKQTAASLNGTLMKHCETNDQLENELRVLDTRIYKLKLEKETINSHFQNFSKNMTEITQAMELELLDQSNATKKLQNQIEDIELENRNILDALLDNITRLKEAMGIIEDVTGVDCHDIFSKGARQDGIYTIAPEDWTSPPFKVFCDMSDGGWTLLQRRIDGSVNFTRSWNEYVNGFGDLDHEFWLGLEKIHHLTRATRRVKFDFQLRDGTPLYLEYGIFQVGDLGSQYTLRVEQHIAGLKANSFMYNNRKKFVTYDRDNPNTCARRRFGGWWYDYCTYLNINGKYSLQNSESGMTEHCCGSRYNNFKKTIMKIK